MPKIKNPVDPLSEEQLKFAKTKSNLLAAALKKEREKQGLSLEDVCAGFPKINDRAALMRIENGQSKLAMNLYFQYCEILKINPIRTFTKTLKMK